MDLERQRPEKWDGLAQPTAVAVDSGLEPAQRPHFSIIRGVADRDELERHRLGVLVSPSNNDAAPRSARAAGHHSHKVEPSRQAPLGLDLAASDEARAGHCASAAPQHSADYTSSVRELNVDVDALVAGMVHATLGRQREHTVNSGLGIGKCRLPQPARRERPECPLVLLPRFGSLTLKTSLEEPVRNGPTIQCVK
jgi:hypothetical protein